MSDRNCPECVWHNGTHCTSFDCEYLSYSDAKNRLSYYSFVHRTQEGQVDRRWFQGREVIHMTIQEAIEILRDTPIDIRSTREDDIHTLYATAQNMAIEALSETKRDLSEDDLIRRQDAIDEIEERKNANGYRNVAVISELNRLEGYIMRLPSAQPERKGEWERASFYDDTLVCSECYVEGRWDWDFCPNCGADMRGDS